MPGPNSSPCGDAGLVRGYPGEQFVCVRKHVCGDSECKMESKRFVSERTGKTKA